jgi:hypothetical protein
VQGRLPFVIAREWRDRGDEMPRVSLKKARADADFDLLWRTIGRTLRLLVALWLCTTLVVMLLHGLNLL